VSGAHAAEPRDPRRQDSVPRMKILQLTSDWKWTGPAAPMLELLQGLRAAGHRVELACPRGPNGMASGLVSQAEARGIAPVLDLLPARGVRWRRDAADARRLRALLESEAFDVVHTWHTRDHVLALRAGRARRRAGALSIARSYKSAEPIRDLPWNRWLFGRGCDGLVCVSPGVARANRRLRGGRPLLGAFGAVDPERFRPAPADKAVRESLGLQPGQRVVGIVARAQRHRRFELLLEAASLLLRAQPEARLLVIGRGTHIRETAEEPAARLGIADRVIFAGYRSDDYVDVLRCVDVLTFLVPGSDGGCRAVLEAAACGIPAIVTSRGALPELVLDGETGYVVDERPQALAAAWGRVLGDPVLRARLGDAARQRAERVFSPARLAADIEGLYREMRARGV
jgi:L-malate glycosyltransferase